jgi:conjugal transfer pilus assembly protein TraD
MSLSLPANVGSGLPLPVERLLGWLMTQTAHCILGAVLGAICARAMRRRQLHWSWAGVALVLVLLTRRWLDGAGSTLVLATLWTAGTARRWHREDADGGGDLADRARGRRSPLDLLASLGRAVAWRLGRGRGSAGWQRNGELALGRDERGRTVAVPYGDGRGRHALVVGATGSGKTVTQTWIATRAIARGSGAIVIDPKGDDGMRTAIRRSAVAAGRPFLEWSPRGESLYNPYARGGETEISDKVLAGERFTEPHYLRQAQRYLGHAVRALRASGVVVDLQSIVDHLDPDRLERLARVLPESSAEATHAYLDSLTSRQRSDLAGVRDRLAILAESDVGPWLDGYSDDRPRLELLDAVRARAVVYFSLESDSRPLLTQMLGAAIVQDLLTTVATLQGRPVQTLVVIDEFSAVAADQVVRLFGRARSAGFSLLLGTQELSDLRPPGRERLLEQVMGNLSLLIAHRQVVPASADLVARVAGTRGAWRVSRHSDGRATRTRTREELIEPNRILGLARGWAAVIALAEGRRARIARMSSTDSEVRP